MIIQLKIAVKTNKMHPKYINTFTMVNLLLGAGPIILPYAFFKAGIILSSIWTLIIAFISYLTAIYIAESIANIKKIDSTLIISDNSIVQNTSKQNSQKNQGLFGSSTSNNQDSSSLIQSKKKQKKYDHIELFTILYGQKYKIFPSLAVSIYLLGTAISKCIMTGNVLSKVFQKIDVMNSFYLWLGLFFVSGAAFSFKSIANTKILQIIIVAVRFLSILLMFFGSIYIMINYGTKQPIPSDGGYFNIENFTQIFSNTLFSLMCHHSLPGIAQSVKDFSDTRYFIRLSFFISCLTLFIIPLTACFTFGDQLGSYDYHYYNFNFEHYEQTSFIYYIVSFYVFLNVAAFSVYIIVIRTNILKVIKPQIDPMQKSKETIIYTGILLAIILAASVLLENKIQVVFNFTGGIFGSLVLFFIPAFQRYSSRKKIGFKSQSFKEKIPFFVMVFGGILMLFNLYWVIYKLVNEKQLKQMINNL